MKLPPWLGPITPRVWFMAAVIVVLVAFIAWTNRYEAFPAGTQSVDAWVFDRWKGTIQVCRPPNATCLRVFPPD